MTDPAEQSVRTQLARRTGTQAADWHLVFKARYGMEVVFRELAAAREPGTVATQTFTCATAIDPIIVGRMTPTYSDVSADSIALDPARLRLDRRTRAVMVQHTFGIIDQPATIALREAALAARALLIEDSCHCLGRMARDADGTPLADISIHSFGVEKMLPTRFGGAIWVNPDLPDEILRDRINRHLDLLPVVGRRLDLVSRAYRNQVRVLGRLPGPARTIARRGLDLAKAFEPPIGEVETQAQLPYEPMRPSAWMLGQIAAELPGLEDQERERCAAVEVYREQLGDLVEIPGAIDAPMPLVRFPFFVRAGADAEQVIEALTAAGVYAGRWYRPALFPGVADPAAYHYQPNDPELAVTRDLIGRVVNLPTAGGGAGARQAARALREILG